MKYLTILFFIILCFADTTNIWLSEIEMCKVLRLKYNAQLEYVLWDGSRVDLYTDSFAIEVDWAYKWKEGIGQALLYGILSGKIPTVLLLVKDYDKEKDYLYRCQIVCSVYKIKLFIEKALKK